MKSKIILFCLLAAVLTGGSAFAQDPGVADTIALEFAVDTTALTATVQLWVYSDENVIGAGVGFSWAGSLSDHLVMDSAKAASGLISAFAIGPYLYEDDNVTLTNTNKRFLFGGAALTATGFAADASGRRLWATYYFSLTSWGGYNADGFSIDTLMFNGSTDYRLVASDQSVILPDFNGPFIFGDPALDAGSDTPTKPEVYSLSQNYPNPFNPTTEISFNLAQNSHVTLTVYNILGQAVTTLIDGDRQKGPNSVTWNAGENATGIYFYKLTAGDFTQTRKMMLLK
jgi:hypothetical protein